MALVGELVSTVLFVGIFIGIYGLLAIGLNVHWGDAGLLNFAHAGFFMVGAYTSAILTTAPGTGMLVDRTIGFQLPVFVGLLASMIVAGVVGVGIAVTSVRLRGDYLAMVTLSAAEILRSIVRNEGWLTAGTKAIKSIPKPLDALGASLPFGYDLLYFVLTWVIVGLVWFGVYRMSISPFGRLLRGLREDEVVLKALGRNTEVLKLKAFGIGAGIAGLAGALYAHYFTTIQPSIFGPGLTFTVWAAIIIGGPGSYLGALLGMGFVQMIRQVTRYIPGDIPLSAEVPYIRVMLIGLLLISVLYFKPEGLLGDKQRMLAGTEGGE
jgi:branched-chain amino acid transport system permease protein